MKHISPTEVAVETAVRAPTRRALAKQQTRQKVLAAARRLFSEEGYEGATIRDIAAAAGMSTGAVFANFTDKSDLFREIMTTDIAELVAQMGEAAAKGRGVEDSLTRLFMTGYSFYKARLPLARAAFAVSWDSQDGPTLRSLAGVQELQELFARQLEAGVAAGELAQESEVKLRSQMLYEIYLANFRQAIFEGWSLDALQARVRDQVRVLLAGARKG